MTRTIEFAGRRWCVKRADEPAGPGDNRFDDSVDAVTVNADGSLSLRLRRVDGRWWCAEIVGEEATGHGTYEWTVLSGLRGLDRNVVVGMFTWSEDPVQRREIDVEVSAWGRPDGVGGQFVVQPFDAAGHLRPFVVPAVAPWSCSFDWSPRRVSFRAGPQTWTFDRPGVPPPGTVHPRINLWLYRGTVPATADPIEVRFGGFRFTPRPG